MNDDELNIEEGNKSAAFKIDIRTLLLAVKRKLVFIVIFYRFIVVIVNPNWVFVVGLKHAYP